MTLQPPVVTQIVAERDGTFHRDFFRWLTRLTNEVRFGVVPVGGIVLTTISAADIAASFTSGVGNAGGTYEGWAICDGNNGTPDLDAQFPRLNTSAAGGTGGSDSSAHTHDIDHNHGPEATGVPTGTQEVQSGTGATVASSNHLHSYDLSAITATSGAASSTENRPAYYELVPIMRIF